MSIARTKSVLFVSSWYHFFFSCTLYSWTWYCHVFGHCTLTNGSCLCTTLIQCFGHFTLGMWCLLYLPLLKCTKNGTTLFSWALYYGTLEKHFFLDSISFMYLFLGCRLVIYIHVYKSMSCRNAKELKALDIKAGITRLFVNMHLVFNRNALRFHLSF